NDDLVPVLEVSGPCSVQMNDDEFLADILLNRPRGLSIPGPMQSHSQQPTQTTDPKEKGKGILVEEPKKKTVTLEQIRTYLRIVDFEKSAQDRESLEAISMIIEFKVIDSPDGEYLIIYRANNYFRAFNTPWEILRILDKQDLYHLYLVV
ncbi:hypothetical protein Tco_0159897, partial [Tanacetum coccineum]